MALFTILALVALLFGVISPLARRRLLRQHPAPGNLIDASGYRLHIHVLGQGGPAVIFDAGLGASGLVWAPMQRDVAAFTTAVTYDRAGLGWSEPGGRPRTNHVMVEELHALLRNTGIPGPYVLVGHSLGGLNARLYAHTYPQDVAGLVLVDAVHEEQFSPPAVKAAMARMARVTPIMYGAIRFLVYSGLPALRPSLLNSALDGIFGRGSVPQDIHSAVRALLAANPRHHAALAAETRAIDTSHAQIRAQKLANLDPIPVVVISHGRIDDAPMLDPQVVRLAEETFQQCQRAMVDESPRGRHIIATESGHSIPFEQPELVLNAIRELVDQARVTWRATVPAESTPAAL